MSTCGPTSSVQLAKGGLERDRFGTVRPASGQIGFRVEAFGNYLVDCFEVGDKGLLRVWSPHFHVLFVQLKKKTDSKG